MQLLRNLAGAANLKTKISQMFAGEHLNVTEDRAVLHPALRAPRDEVSRIITATCSLLHVACRITLAVFKVQRHNELCRTMIKWCLSTQCLAVITTTLCQRTDQQW